MKTKLRKIFAGLALVCFAMALLVAGAEAKTQIKMQCVYPETSNGGVMVKTFAKKVAKYTNGEVEVKLFWPNQLVKVKEAYTAVSKGMVDMLYAASIYYGGIVPASKSQWLPMAWASPEDAYKLFYDFGYMELLRKANSAKGVWLLGTTFSGSMGFMTNFDVTGLDSFKGKKIRAMSVDASLVRGLGASPVAMPGTEMYAAMKRGTIDGVIYPYYIINTYKFSEVTTCVTLPGIHTPNMVDVYMNQKLWESLSPKFQFALSRACEETALLSALWSEKWNRDAFITCKKKGIKIMELSDADQAKLRAMAREDWKKTAAQSPDLKKAVALIEKFLDSKKGK
ncbi:MAG: TRAP transporter substrate-binding protein DctP [Deltaproteobacteria bacterium]|nr:TRAP transporter substrate-binding protein DctP [Deltaproteobacteria bacterium]